MRQRNSGCESESGCSIFPVRSRPLRPALYLCLTTIELVPELLEAGVHFGHQTKRWNPKMKPFIFEKRNAIYIINLDETVKQLQRATDFLQEVAQRGGKILVRRLQKAGAGSGQGSGGGLRPILRQPALARRHPDESRHHPQRASAV